MPWGTGSLSPCLLYPISVSMYMQNACRKACNTCSTVGNLGSFSSPSLPDISTHTYVSMRQHASAYVSIRQHTSAYVSIRQHTSAYVSVLLAFSTSHQYKSACICNLSQDISTREHVYADICRQSFAVSLSLSRARALSLSLSLSLSQSLTQAP